MVALLQLMSIVIAVVAGGIVLTLGIRAIRRDTRAARRNLRIAWLIAKWAFCLFILIGLLASVVFAPVAIVVGAMIWVRVRFTRQYALLLTVAAAVEHRMPLEAALEAFAEENGGFVGMRARQAAALLRAGCSLPQALEQAGGLVPRDALAPIRLGWETGSLVTAIREAADSHSSQDSVWTHVSGKIAYGCLLLAMITLITSFMMLKIAPAFEKIFDDFGTDLPAITVSLVGASNSVANYWYIVGIPLVPILTLLLASTVVHYIGWPGIELPGTGPLVCRFHAAVILNTLALAADRGLPFRGGLAALARSYPRSSIRWRLAAVVLDVDAGADWADRLAAYGLIRKADRAVLQAAQRVGNLPWALREMAASSRRRFLYRVNALMQVAFVLMILLFGVIVLWFFAGFFTPLIALIQTLAS